MPDRFPCSIVVRLCRLDQDGGIVLKRLVIVLELLEVSVHPLHQPAGVGADVHLKAFLITLAEALEALERLGAERPEFIGLQGLLRGQNQVVSLHGQSDGL
jgi:hypothetical protein